MFVKESKYNSLNQEYNDFRNEIISKLDIENNDEVISNEMVLSAIDSISHDDESAKIKSLESNISDLNNTISENKSTINDLKSSNDKLSNDLSIANQTIAAKNKEIEELGKQTDNGEEGGAENPGDFNHESTKKPVDKSYSNYYNLSKIGKSKK
jgi:chromosome segregation ATPase